MSWFKEIETGLFITLSMLLLYVIYTTILKYWDRDRIIDQVIVANLDDPYNVSGIQDFQFEVSDNRSVTFSILDVNESVISVLLDGDVKAGKHTVQLDSSTLKSGWYWYQLTTSKQNITRKFKIQ